MNVIGSYPCSPPYSEYRKKVKSKLDKKAPKLPTDTCMYINFVQEVLQDLYDDTDCKLLEGKIKLMNETLEYVRGANESLRSNASFWRNKYIDKYEKKS